MALAALNGCRHQTGDVKQENEALRVRVTAGRSEALYNPGEKAGFTVEVFDGERRATNGELEVWLARDGGPTGIEKRRFDLSVQNPVQVTGTVDEPAFFLCQAWASVQQARAYGEKMVWYRSPLDPERVAVELKPDRGNGLYQSGEKATFTARVTRNGEPVREGELTLRINAGWNGPAITERVYDLAEDAPLTLSGTTDEATFLYCHASYSSGKDGERPVSMWTSVGYAVEDIKPETVTPDDFKAFWEDALARARALPMDVKLEKIDDLSNTKATYYKFSVNTLNGERVYGSLGIPTGPGPFPVVAFYPGKGPGGSPPNDVGMTPRGAITMKMSVHKYPVPPSREEAKRLMEEYAAKHGASDYFLVGMSSRETFHFHTVLLGFCRALDYVLDHEGWWDGKHLMIFGSSQGGFLTLAMSSLYADKVTAAMAGVPYACDFRRRHKNLDEASLRTMAYYDPVNFARFIRCPIQMSVGFRDGSCPPETVFSAHNVIPGEDKRIMMEPEGHHGVTPGRQAMERERLFSGLGLSGK